MEHGLTFKGFRTMATWFMENIRTYVAEADNATKLSIANEMGRELQTAKNQASEAIANLSDETDAKLQDIEQKINDVKKECLSQIKSVHSNLGNLKVQIVTQEQYDAIEHEENVLYFVLE